MEKTPQKKVLTEEEQILAQEAEALGLGVSGGATAAAINDASKQLAIPGAELEEENITLLQNLNAFDVDDEEIGEGTAKPTSSTAGRHSESKKEMLKVIENSINRLMKERAELEVISRQLAAGEERAEKEVNFYLQMLKFAEKLAPEEMSTKEWEDFFSLHFVQGGRVNSTPTQPLRKIKATKIDVEGAESPRRGMDSSDDEGKRSDMEMD